MKKLILALTIGFSGFALAHDGGHGPQVSDTGKFGGLMAPVVKKADIKLGPKAEMFYKAELARAADGTVRIYLYDKAMKSADLQSFAKEATAAVENKVKGKWKHVPFALELKDGVYIGKMPKSESKPYNLDVNLKNGDTEYLTAFENLD